MVYVHDVVCCPVDFPRLCRLLDERSRADGAELLTMHAGVSSAQIAVPGAPAGVPVLVLVFRKPAAPPSPPCGCGAEGPGPLLKP